MMMMTREAKSKLVMGAQDIRLVLVVALGVLVYQHQAVVALASEQQTGESLGANSNNYPPRDSFDGNTEATSLRPVSFRQTLVGDQFQFDDQVAADDSRLSMFIPLLHNLRIKDIDQAENYKLSPNSKVIEEILNELSQELSGPEQQKRASTVGRVYSYGGANGNINRRQQASANAGIEQPSIYNRYIAQQPSRRLLIVNSSGSRQAQPAVQASSLELDGLPSLVSSSLWQSAGRTGSAMASGRAGTRRSHTSNPRHTSDTAEVAISTPLKSRSVSEYDWKRVENSRWNNLRGMWGKRSVPVDGGADQAPATEPAADKSPAKQQQTTRLVGNFM